LMIVVVIKEENNLIKSFHIKNKFNEI